MGLPEAASLTLQNVTSGLESTLERISIVGTFVGLDKKRVMSIMDGGASEAYKAKLERMDQAPVKAMAWHSYCQALAFLHRQDVVRLVDLTAKNAWHPPSKPLGRLKAPSSKRCHLYCLERPCAAATIAVGCKDGVCLWTVQPFETNLSSAGKGTPAIFRTETFSSAPSAPPPLFPSLPDSKSRILDDNGPSTPPISFSPEKRIVPPSVCKTHMSFLSHHAMIKVTALAWSPDGTRLAVGTATSPRVIIWDIATETPHIIPAGVGSGTRSLRWSEDGKHIVQVCFKKTLRVWETEGFMSFELEAGPGFVDACWLDRSKTLAFAIAGVPRVSMLQILEATEKGLDYRMHPQHEKLPRFEGSTEKGKPIIVGGPVKSIEVDPTYKRLAITFEDEGEGGQLVALLELKFDPLPEFLPIGFIRGPKWTEELAKPQPPRSPYSEKSKGKDTASAEESTQQPRPIVISFARRFPGGALLTVAWENGKVGAVPCQFGELSQRAFRPIK
ncbi:WD40-repeat-containing domain protein [Chytridium lagenaria]|nr:WD40-repeat-containing domain protein [Chytridium lagenaria]